MPCCVVVCCVVLCCGILRSAHRMLPLCGTVEPQLLVQILHTAELRLRLQAFLTHFQHNSSSGEAAGAAVQTSGALAVQTAFAAAVADVLAEHDASLAMGQVSKLTQPSHNKQQQGHQQHHTTNSSNSSNRNNRTTLAQLLAVQHNMARQLQQLAELCWCTVQAYVDLGMYLKEGQGATHTALLRPTEGRASNISSSSTMMLWHMLRRRGGGSGNSSSNSGSKQERAASAAALARAAAEATAQALPWPASTSSGGGGSAGVDATAAAVKRLGWAPSSWQLRQGFDGGDSLVWRLHEGGCVCVRVGGQRAECGPQGW